MSRRNGFAVNASASIPFFFLIRCFIIRDSLTMRVSFPYKGVSLFSPPPSLYYDKERGGGADVLYNISLKFILYFIFIFFIEKNIDIFFFLCYYLFVKKKRGLYMYKYRVSFFDVLDNVYSKDFDYFSDALRFLNRCRRSPRYVRYSLLCYE